MINENQRQVFHILLGIAFIVLIYFDVLTAFRIFVLLIFGIIISLLSKKYKISIVWQLLRKFERPSVMKKFPGKGTIFFFVGVLLVLRLFEKDIALASIIILTFGDSVSHIIGMKFGRIKHPFNGNGKKKLEGTVAGTIVAFLGALIFVHPLLAFLGALTGMGAEALQLQLNNNEVDDNIIVPLVAGTVMLLMRYFLL